VFFRYGGSEASLFTVQARGGEPRLLLRNGDEPAWSPDGRRVAFVRGGDIDLLDLASGRVVRAMGQGSSPAWQPAH
jgi:Tol biopolymer transport system component